MEIKTKLSIGDPMYIIEASEYDKPITCSGCGGTGKINLQNGKQYKCPECYGRGYFENKVKKEWRIFDDRTPDSLLHIYGRPVGEIKVEVHQDGRKKNPTIKTIYTPRGVGNFFYEENVFPTIEDAQTECDKRNKEI